MSKMDNLRAMREARYEKAVSRASGPAAAPKPTRATTAAKATKPAAPAPAAEAGLPEDALCGHRAISGRTCTREQGHAAKSHRYA